MNKALSMQARLSMRLFSWKGLLGLGSGLALILFWSLVVLRIVSHPENHIGVSVLWILPLPLMAVLAGGLWLSTQLRRAGWALLVLGLLSSMGVVLLDQLDILVEYESWLERGMPDRPF
ncbi:hypothetical protein [Cystobacter fuscus]|uniref:hypothetical protein n=1 Tax=Cystobacter fuscus TaxID=43 RepID=UPI0037C0ACA3